MEGVTGRLRRPQRNQSHFEKMGKLLSCQLLIRTDCSSKLTLDSLVRPPIPRASCPSVLTSWHFSAII